MVDIEIYHDRVTVEDKTIQRPDRVSPSDWMAFWEAAKGEHKPEPVKNALGYRRRNYRR